MWGDDSCIIYYLFIPCYKNFCFLSVCLSLLSSFEMKEDQDTKTKTTYEEDSPGKCSSFLLVLCISSWCCSSYKPFFFLTRWYVTVNKWISKKKCIKFHIFPPSPCFHVFMVLSKRGAREDLGDEGGKRRRDKKFIEQVQ